MVADSAQSFESGGGCGIKLGWSSEPNMKAISSEWVGGTGPPFTLRVKTYANVLGCRCDTDRAMNRALSTNVASPRALEAAAVAPWPANILPSSWLTPT